MDPKAIALIRVVDDDRAVSKAIQFLLENPSLAESGK